MNAVQVLAYYSRPDVQEAMLREARGREVAGVYRSGGFGQRPNILAYPQDILSQVRGGVVEFHCSLERWDNPMTLRHRAGFDLILDLDCRRFEHGKIAAHVLTGVLRDHGLRTIAVKFTGNRGFHVGIPWGSIPPEINLEKTAAQFPGIARTVAQYLKEVMRERLAQALLRRGSPEALAAEAERPLAKVVAAGGIDPFQVVDIDPVLLSPRHLFRMPYSLNMKTFLVSLPLEQEALEGFERVHADPERIRAAVPFLRDGAPGEADLLFAEAADWAAKRSVRQSREAPPRPSTTAKIPEDLFPPCIRNIQRGMADGKKRATFILINFLRSCHWELSEVERFLKDWNSRNHPPLPEQYLTTSLRYYRAKKSFPPPNCSQDWYTGLGVCAPDHVCGGQAKTVKNPVNYPLKVMGRKQRNRRAPPRPRRRGRRFAATGYGPDWESPPSRPG